MRRENTRLVVRAKCQILSAHLVAGMLALTSCYLVSLEFDGGQAQAQSSTSTAPASPSDTAKVDTASTALEGFSFRIWEQIGKDEIAERAVIRVMAPDGTDKIIELEVDAGHIVQMASYVEEPGNSPPPPSKHFDVEIAVDYIKKNSDGSEGEQVHVAASQSVDIPLKANLMVTVAKDGSIALSPQ